MPTTLLQLRTSIRQRTDNEHTGSQFVSDSELNGYINNSYKELYATLVRTSLQFIENTYTVPVDGSTSYALPEDFYSLLGVYYTTSGVNYRLERFSDRFSPGTATTGQAGQYRIKGSELVLYPKPDSGVYFIEYIPVAGDLTADDDTLDGVLGWEEWVVVDASIKVLIKEESDTRVLQFERDRIMQRIKDDADAVEFSETRCIENTDNCYDPTLLEGSYWPRRGYRGRI